MIIRVIDLETTGTDPETDKIVELAFLQLPTKEHQPLYFEALINPGVKIPAAALRFATQRF